jgi:hypothetical protein
VRVRALESTSASWSLTHEPVCGGGTLQCMHAPVPTGDPMRSRNLWLEPTYRTHLTFTVVTALPHRLLFLLFFFLRAIMTARSRPSRAGASAIYESDPTSTGASNASPSPTPSPLGTSARTAPRGSGHSVPVSITEESPLSGDASRDADKDVSASDASARSVGAAARRRSKWSTDDLTSPHVERRMSEEDDAYIVDSLMPGSRRHAAMTADDVREAARGEMKSFSRARAKSEAEMKAAAEAKTSVDAQAAAEATIATAARDPVETDAAAAESKKAEEAAVEAEKQRRHLELENERVTWE